METTQQSPKTSLWKFMRHHFGWLALVYCMVYLSHTHFVKVAKVDPWVFIRHIGEVGLGWQALIYIVAGAGIGGYGFELLEALAARGNKANHRDVINNMIGASVGFLAGTYIPSKAIFWICAAICTAIIVAIIIFIFKRLGIIPTKK